MSDSGKLHTEGISHFRAGRLDEAARSFEQAFQAAEDAGDPRKAAEALNDLGVTRRELDEFDAAKASLDQAYDIFTRLEDEKGQAQTLGNLGSVLEGQGAYEEAADAYRQSAKIFEDLGETDMAMYSWQALSRLHTKYKQWLPAIAAYEEGIDNMPDSSIKKGFLKRIMNLPAGWLSGR